MRLAFVCASVVAGAAVVAAQGGAGRIDGRVVEQTNTALPGVRVTATSADGAVRREAVTNAEGMFELALPLRVYALKAELVGFRAPEQPVVLSAPGIVTADFAMAVSPCFEQDHPVLFDTATTVEQVPLIALVRVSGPTRLDDCVEHLYTATVTSVVKGVLPQRITIGVPQYSPLRFSSGDEYLVFLSPRGQFFGASYLFTFPVDDGVVEWHPTDRPEIKTRITLASLLETLRTLVAR